MSVDQVIAIANQGILEDNIPGVKAGRKTIFRRAEGENSSNEDLKDEVIVLNDYGFHRG